jgi:hypothetical protein
MPARNTTASRSVFEGIGAGVRAHPAERLAAIDHGHAPAELGSLDGSLLASGTGADHQ